jgi:hypothetical protein
MIAGLKRSMPCENLNELVVIVVAPSSSSSSSLCSSSSAGAATTTRFLGSCDFKRQRTSISSVSVASISDDDDSSQASPSSSSAACFDSFCDSNSSSSSPATAALEEALAMSSECDLDLTGMPDDMDSAVHVFFDFSFPQDDDCCESSSLNLPNVMDDMTRAMVHMTTVSNQA